MLTNRETKELKLIHQTRLVKNENSFHACLINIINLECLLELKLKDAPRLNSIYNHEKDYHKPLVKFLSKYNYNYRIYPAIRGESIETRINNTCDYSIGLGLSNRDTKHACIYYKGELFFDPYPRAYFKGINPMFFMYFYRTDITLIEIPIYRPIYKLND